MTHVSGLHHITAISGPPQETVDFYIGTLGLRLVKRSINQDVPDTYHLFFADGAGHPGTDITFFPWPSMGPGRAGAGVWGEVAFSIPEGSADWWQERLAAAGVAVTGIEDRFGERVVVATDPHGMAVALVETHQYEGFAFAPWSDSTVPADRQIQALSSVRLVVREMAPTAAFLAEAFGFAPTATQEGWTRFTVGEGVGGQRIDIIEDSDARLGKWGVGAVHHVAFRVPDDPEEAAVRSQVIAAGGAPSQVIDRFWFRSVYVREPSGALCEVATDVPGFSVDEDPNHLGETLVLPPWYEQQREAIEAVLPPITLPEVPAQNP